MASVTVVEGNGLVPCPAGDGASEEVSIETSSTREAPSWLLWPLLATLPLALTAGAPRYRNLFPAHWFDEEPIAHPGFGLATWRKVKPLGLCLGLAAVVVGQACVIVYHSLRRWQYLGRTTKIQDQDRPYDLSEGIRTHLAQPEGFVLLGGYLAGSWMFGLMPSSYYAFGGGLNWLHVAVQLLLQDSLQYCMHVGEHKISTWIYRHSHKPHHRFTNPRIFDAFNGSLSDTLLMVVAPLAMTAQLVASNVWSYMAFGSIYAGWLVLIHSEYSHPWDALFRALGFATPADHHVHHRLFTYNYGHLFVYWDKIFGTYQDPRSYRGTYFNKEL
mmetsp:Transcript_68075/g.127124  ORF Transcript_68075/g.127124 Transcript_68075/m.127124 type:complete len:329 (+) Transcript_68075:54-1040(+)